MSSGTDPASQPTSAPADAPSIQENSSAFDSMIEFLVDPLIVIDRAGVVLNANPAACHLFGWNRDDLIGEKVNVLMGEPYRTEHDEYLQRFLTTGESHAIGRVRKVIARDREGRDFPAELSVSFAIIDGRHRFYGIVRDITDRETMVARLAQAERLTAMGELAAGIAHEVNNPVNTIINCAQLVKDGDDDPTLLDNIVQEGMRIAMIVRDLLDFARDRPDAFAPIDIPQTVRRVLNLVGRRLERQGVHLSTDFEQDLPKIDGIAHQIQQVLLNIVLNARDALVEQSREQPHPMHIAVGATRLDDETGRTVVRVTVRDNGPGIAAADHERIFDPFFTKKGSKGGTGLGLAVSRGLVSAHGGTIRVRSEVGEFTEFVIDFPVRG